MELGPKFLNSLFEVAHVEFQTYDLAAGKVIFSSGVACQLLGYTKEEYALLSADFYKNIIHPDDLEQAEATINKLIHGQNGQIAEMTIRFRRMDDNYIWLYSRQMVYERVPYSGELTILREVEDVTRLMDLQDKLHQKVEQLKAVSFINSHLLRSPVASIIGLIDLIEEEAITSDHNRQVFQYLKDTIVRLDEVIHEINDKAKE